MSFYEVLSNRCIDYYTSLKILQAGAILSIQSLVLVKDERAVLQCLTNNKRTVNSAPALADISSNTE